MKAQMKKVKADKYACIARERDKLKYEFHIRKKAKQRRREVERRLERSDDVSMYRL